MALPLLRSILLILLFSSQVAARALDLDRLLKEGTLDAFKTEHAIERCDVTAHAILLRAEAALSEGRPSEAMSLAEIAVRFSPDTPLPHFFLAKAHFLKINLPAAAQHYLAALFHALNDFWFLFSTLGIFLLVSLTAFLLSILLFALFSLFYIGRLWVHEWTERFGWYPALVWGVYLILILIPLLLGLPPVGWVLFCFLLAWGFYRRAERAVVILFLVIMGSASWVLPLLPPFFVAKSSVFLNQMVRNVQGTSPFLPQRLSQSDWRETLMLASHALHNRAYADAEAFYQNALLKQPKSPLLLNNIGNLYFYLNDYKRAIAYYQQALGNNPKSALVHYNMSQAYRAMLLFEEGEKEYGEALSTNRADTERYTQRAVLYPALPVVEARFTQGDLWREALTHTEAGVSEALWRGWAGGIPLSQSHWIALAFSVLLPFSSTFLKSFYTGRPCAICRRAICERCEQVLFDYSTCPECTEQFSAMTQNRLADVEHARKQVPQRDIPFFLIPGGGQIVMGRTVMGFSLLFLTTFVGLLLFLGDALFSSIQWHLHISSLFLVLCILAFYAISVFSLTPQRHSTRRDAARGQS